MIIITVTGIYIGRCKIKETLQDVVNGDINWWNLFNNFCKNDIAKHILIYQI